MALSRRDISMLAAVAAFTVLAGCAPLSYPAGQTQAPPTSQVQPPTATLTPSPTPVPQSYPGCYYTWSTKELPALSATFSESLQAADAKLTGSAYAFGEDCVSDDGTRRFGAMETDFRVRAEVDSLSNESGFGGLMAKAMHIVLGVPPSMLAGPNPGRVEFEFVTPGGSSLRLIVPISRFRAEAQDLDGITLFRYFHTAP